MKTKKTMLIVLGSLMFGGCGLSVIQKQKLLTSLEQGKAQVDETRGNLCTSACSQSLTDKLNALYILIESQIENYK